MVVDYGRILGWGWISFWRIFGLMFEMVAKFDSGMTGGAAIIL